MRTFSPKVPDIQRAWYVVDADGLVLGRLASQVAHCVRTSGYPGGLRSTSYAELLAKSPDELIRRSIRGMLPKNTLGRQMLSKLNVYAGPEHPHAAQQPEALELPRGPPGQLK